MRSETGKLQEFHALFTIYVNFKTHDYLRVRACD